MSTATTTTAKPRPRRLNGGGDPELVQLLGTNYRFWARLPERVRAVLLLGPAGSKPEALAAIARPDFPAGVCTGCGCQEHDACIVTVASAFGFGDEARGCSWIDTTRTRCSACGPVVPVKRAARGRRR